MTLRRFGKLLRLLPEPVFRRGLRFGVGAAIEHRAALSSLGLETIVDVGANVGQFSLLARALYPSSRIVAFEPLREAAARYRRVFAGDPKTALHEAAIAPCAGAATLHVSASADSSSLLPITDRQVARFPGTWEVAVATVDAAPLDTFLSPAEILPPALLKIDVQGFELEVLRASRSLLDTFGHVYVEASFEELYEGQALAGEVAAFLAEHGFAETGRFNVSTSAAGAAIQADFLFRRTGGATAPAGQVRGTPRATVSPSTASKRATIDSMSNADSA